MKSKVMKCLGVAVLASLTIAVTAPAALIVDEDWETQDIADNFRLDDTTTWHPGWQFTQGNGNIFKNQDGNGDGVPGARARFQR